MRSMREGPGDGRAVPRMVRISTLRNEEAFGEGEVAVLIVDADARDGDVHLVAGNDGGRAEERVDGRVDGALAGETRRLELPVEEGAEVDRAAAGRVAGRAGVRRRDRVVDVQAELAAVGDHAVTGDRAVVDVRALDLELDVARPDGDLHVRGALQPEGQDVGGVRAARLHWWVTGG